MKLWILTLMLSSSVWTHALNITKDSSIDDVIASMKSEGYEKSEERFVMIPPDKCSLSFWAIGKNTLIVTHNVYTKKVEALVFHISGDRDCDACKEFKFDVKRFNTESGEMIIAKKNKLTR